MNELPIAKMLVLEDEPFVAEQICDELRDQLAHEGIEVFCENNLQAASQLAQSDQLSYLIADAKVKEVPTSKEPNADAQSLLRSLRGQRFITTIAHTAYRDKFATIERDHLADIIVDKHQKDSTEQVIQHGIRVARQRQHFCRTLWAAYDAVRQAVECEDPIDKQALIRQSRDYFGVLTAPEFATENYRRATIWLSTFGMRLSAVPSKRFNLFPLEATLLDVLQPMFFKLIGTRFNYDNDAFPAMARLEALGYPVMTRVDI